MPMSDNRYDTEEDQQLMMEARPIGRAGMGGVALVSAGASVLSLAFGQGDVGRRHDNAAVGVLIGSLILIAAGWLVLWRDRRGSRLDRGSLGKIIASALIPCLLISAVWIAIVILHRREPRAPLRRNHIELSVTTADHRTTDSGGT